MMLFIGFTLALALRCGPMRPLPAETAARRREEQEGYWPPCGKRFGVPRPEADGWAREKVSGCEAGDGAACAAMAFVKMWGCLGPHDVVGANAFAGKGCDRRDVAACLLQLDLCGPENLSCTEDVKAVERLQAVEVGTARCLSGSDADCETVDEWYRGGKLGLSAEGGRVDKVLSAACTRGEEAACGPLARREVARRDVVSAQAIFMRYCAKPSAREWACDGLWQLAAAYEGGRLVGQDASEAYRIYDHLCRVGEVRGCEARTRLGHGH
jgi:hypothetical protein